MSGVDTYTVKIIYVAIIDNCKMAESPASRSLVAASSLLNVMEIEAVRLFPALFL